MNAVNFFEKVMGIAQNIDATLTENFSEHGYSSLHAPIAAYSAELRRVAWEFSSWASEPSKITGSQGMLLSDCMKIEESAQLIDYDECIPAVKATEADMDVPIKKKRSTSKNKKEAGTPYNPFSTNYEPKP